MPPAENHNHKGGESGVKTVSLVDLVKGGLSSWGCKAGRKNKGHRLRGRMNQAAQILQPCFWLACPPERGWVSPVEARTGGELVAFFKRAHNV